MDQNKLSVPMPHTAAATDLLKDALFAYKGDLLVAVNERCNQMLQYGELVESMKWSKAPENVYLQRAEEVNEKLKALEKKIQVITLLITSIDAIEHLRNQAAKPGGVAHFPQLRMRLPLAIHVVLSMVGDYDREISDHDMMMLAAFSEHHRYTKLLELQI